VEGRHKVNKGRLVKLSEQQLVDCQHSGCHGCGGGQENKGFDYYQNHDACTEQEYGYTGRNGNCKDSRCSTGIRTKGHSNVQKNNPNAMKSALSGGPLSVAIEADKACFQNYRSGIFDNASCGTRLNHAVGLVGWGKQSGREYWIVRNSWGKSWGESGYIRMAIESGKGVCGVQSDASLPKSVS